MNGDINVFVCVRVSDLFEYAANTHDDWQKYQAMGPLLSIWLKLTGFSSKITPKYCHVIDQQL